MDKITLRTLLWPRRDERPMMTAVLVLLVALNALTIAHYQGFFTPQADNYWNLFVTRFQVSGFDPISYYVISDWEARYNVYRHPLLAFVMWIPYLINRALMILTGINCALYIMCAIQIVAAWYAFLFLYRLIHDVLAVAKTDARLLCFFMYSFAMVMVTTMVPDHFVLSLCLLLFTLYVTGLYLQRHRAMGVWATIGLFVATAGISLNNGLKVFMAALWVNGRRFFRPQFILGAVLIPAIALWWGCRNEYHYLVAPGENARHAANAKRKAEQRQREAERQRQAAVTMTLKAATDSAHRTAAAPAKPKAKRQPKKGAPLMEGEFMRWTDMTTPRWASIVENLMGESIQLHPDYLLQDESRSRPMIIKYRWAANYVVEAIIAMLFVMGIWCGRRNRLLWVALSWWAMDMALHVGIGFGLNEIYIMTAQWIYVIPLAMAFLFSNNRWMGLKRGLVAALTLYLYIYNGYFIIDYMLC
ncbi:MAG: DUF6080 domain-containing protein [Prevotella sp.]|nr:DUF6080 domain-containing protein [Prevotella sp.]MDY3247429.1 DUF6080 domain-containing protein [Prevotella sp.]